VAKVFSLHSFNQDLFLLTGRTLMKKVKSILLSALALAFLVVAPQFASAAKNNTSFLNGKPFANLSAQIQANADSISALNSSTAAIQAELDALTTVVNDHEARITANEGNISSLLQNFSDLSVQVNGNSNLIATLITDLELLEGEVADNKVELEGQISALGAQLVAARTELLGMLATLSQEVLIQRQELDAVDAQINAAIATINGQIQALNTTIANVRDEIAANQQVTTDALALANFQINSLLVDVTTLQGAVGTLEQTSSDLDAAIQVNVDAIAQLQGSIDGLDLRIGQLEGSGLIDSITFEVLNTSCNPSSNYEFSLNGQSLGTGLADPSHQCQCAGVINNYSFNDVSAWNFAGDNTLRFNKSGGNAGWSWVRANISRGTETQSVCIADHNGGTCSVTDLCNAQYTFGDVDQSLVVPNTFTGGGLEALQAQVVDLNNEIASLQSQIDSNDGDISSLQTQLAAAEQSLSDLETQVADFHTPALETFLANLNASSSTIVAGIPSRFNFSDGFTGFEIRDGGNDMYDGGNRMGTNNAGNIAYTNGAIVENNSFGAGSSYFTAKYPGLFVMAADNVDINLFNINGNNGADGQGFTNATQFTLTVDGQVYTVFAKRTTDNLNTRDPSINQIIVIPGNSGASHTWASNTNDGNQQVSGLTGVNRIVYLLTATWNPSAVLSNTNIANLVRSVLQNQ
jgi:peptidoglycan hydrolase CwlO-like protein